MKRGKAMPRLFRFYGYKDRRGVWFGVCLDLNVATEADTPEELRKELNEMVGTYIEDVLNLEDEVSIGWLLNRRAPWRYWFCYYLLCWPDAIRKFSRWITFTETHLQPAFGNC